MCFHKLNFYLNQTTRKQAFIIHLIHHTIILTSHSGDTVNPYDLIQPVFFHIVPQSYDPPSTLTTYQSSFIIPMTSSVRIRSQQEYVSITHHITHKHWYYIIQYVNPPSSKFIQFILNKTINYNIYKKYANIISYPNSEIYLTHHAYHSLFKSKLTFIKDIQLASRTSIE